MINIGQRGFIRLCWRSITGVSKMKIRFLCRGWTLPSWCSLPWGHNCTAPGRQQETDQIPVVQRLPNWVLCNLLLQSLPPVYLVAVLEGCCTVSIEIHCSQWMHKSGLLWIGVFSSFIGHLVHLTHHSLEIRTDREYLNSQASPKDIWCFRPKTDSQKFLTGPLWGLLCCAKCWDYFGLNNQPFK